MKNSERAEFRLGNDTVYLRDNNILYVEVVGHHTAEFASEMKKLCTHLVSQMDAQCCYLINLNKSGKNDPGARSIWKELSIHEKIYKVATFGLNPVARVIANFVIGSYSGNNIRFFNTEKEAVEWLTKKEK